MHPNNLAKYREKTHSPKYISNDFRKVCAKCGAFKHQRDMTFKRGTSRHNPTKYFCKDGECEHIHQQND